jgi:hypothetical protein
MGVSLKTERRRSHTAVAGFVPWVRRAEGYREIRQIKTSRQVPVTPRRPPSLPLVCEVFPGHSSFSVLRETPMAFFCDNFKQLTCYKLSLFPVSITFFEDGGNEVVHGDIVVGEDYGVLVFEVCLKKGLGEE